MSEEKIYEPVIISASRATDIAGFFGDWFVDKWQKGYCVWVNPFNQKQMKISLQKARAVVFWTKYPKDFLRHLNFVKENIPIFYFQHTLNDYDDENIELNVPSLKKRVELFKMLSENIGKERVIWRFDPLILSDKISIEILLEKIEFLGDELKNHTQKLVFSFLDIYKKTALNMQKLGIKYELWDDEKMNEFAAKLAKLNADKKWGFTLATCTEKIDLKKHGISHNKCVDDELILHLLSQKISAQNFTLKDEDKELLRYLGREFTKNIFGEITFSEATKNIKDKGQRSECGCIQSKDIGAYNTCLFGCAYCYANDTLEKPKANFRHYDPKSDRLINLNTKEKL